MESENICNMPQLATIKIHQSEETGKTYLEYICWNGRGYDGLWQDSKPIPKETIEKIYDMLEENTELETNEHWLINLPHKLLDKELDNVLL